MTQPIMAQHKSSRSTVAGLVHLVVKESGKAIALNPQTKIWIVGRSCEQNTVDVDLMPFGAYRLGVSRQHLRLESSPMGLTVTDLNSTYGSSLNAEGLLAGHDYLLHDGDELVLGALVLIVSFTR